MSDAVKWGLVATVKAEPAAILGFAAHHLDLGAHRIYLCLDAPCPGARDHLKAHHKIRVIDCDDRHWRRLNGGRPAMHQVRQTLNATHVYNRPAEVDWLAHIDVDELMWPDDTVAGALAALPAGVQTARIRPLEALAPPGGGPAPEEIAFKALPLDLAARRAATDRLYPAYANDLDDGFLSHVAGKLFLRTGLPDIEFRIHNARTPGGDNPGQRELAAIRLLHLHAHDWADWRARFGYRHEQGAYRAALGRKGPGGLTLHQFFAALLEREGETGLRRFFETVATATPEHCAALEHEGLLFRHAPRLNAAIRKHFPDIAEIVE